MTDAGLPIQAFRRTMAEGYSLDQPALVLGSPMLGDELLTDVHVRVALSMLNRHGLIAGATGTGKTKTLQLMAGQLSRAGVPSFIADIKGDVSGMALPGDADDPRIRERMESLGLPYEPIGHPVELFSLTGRLGAQIRATVSSFGPLLLGKVLGLNDTQTSILALIFKYCDDHDLPLLDLKDLVATLKFFASDEGKPHLREYGGMSSASVGVLLRSIVVFEQEGADVFFGEPELDVMDLLRTTAEGAGVVSLLELSDVMDKPRLFSTFMLWILARLYETLPEVGDLPQPKLCFFFDEAHLLFKDSSKALMEQIERTARLIRSKGVGVYFVTHAPTDVPSPVLSQLGNRIQHALRAFTPEDADALRKTARTFPTSEHYDVERLLTSLGIGEAAVTVLSPRGIPTPLAAVRLAAPDSSMVPLDDIQLHGRIATSAMKARYGETIDRDSAYERINAKLAAARESAAQAAAREQMEPTTQGGLNTMTPAQQQREIQRRAREMAAAQRAADRERRAQAAAERRMAQERARAQREQQRLINSALRGVFGTILGGSRRRR
ncbi:MAG TPA: helicase HerA-like domain-containing protein [Candidatus Limnocylindrales bacterium]|nr:helicase HerA-like domain-containing protein [Candidatus Limnocylindrales bacterium]